MKKVVRDEVISLMKTQILSPKYLKSLANLPRQINREFSKGILANGNKIKMLGNTIDRILPLSDKML